MTYRDELHAAELRIAALESELCARDADLAELRQTRGNKRQRTRWLLDAFAVIVALAFFVVVNETHPSHRRVDELRQALERAQAETMVAREEGRAALEALRQHLESEMKHAAAGEARDPLADAPHEPEHQPPPEHKPPEDEKPASTVELGEGEAVVWAASAPDSQLIVDGVRYGMTPLMVRVRAGSHALAFVHARGIETRTVTVRPGETERVSVRLDGGQK